MDKHTGTYWMYANKHFLLNISKRKIKIKRSSSFNSYEILYNVIPVHITEDTCSTYDFVQYSLFGANDEDLGVVNGAITQH